ncbi:MAG: amidohydrolase family protein [Pseudomonadota bacterium]
MLIDWHTNLWLPEHLGPEQREEMGVRTGKSIAADPDAHLAGVAAMADKFVVLTLRWNQLGIHVPNEFVADYVGRFPDRAIGFACVDPHDDDAPEELERAVIELGLRGLKISPVYAGYDPWSKEAWRLYEVANRLAIPLLWHQSAAYPAASMLEYGNPILLDKIARAFPDLPMIIAHVGQPWIGETVVLLRKHKQLFADLSARYYRQWQCYNALMLALDYKVTDQLLFGSDFPMQTTQEALSSFRAINDWGEDVTLPRFPDEIIEDIISNRPFNLIWPDR